MGLKGFGIIGAGQIARTHAIAITKIDGAVLEGVYDKTKEKAEALCKEFGGKAYTDLQSFLSSPSINNVAITTPSGLHQDCAIAAIGAGKNVIIEKPLEITVERCDRIIKAASQKGVCVSGIFQSRFYDASILTKQAIDSGRLGRIVLCDAFVKWYRSQQYYDSGQWRGTKKIDGGGALMNQAIHAVDLLQWFGGKVSTVYAFGDTLARKNIEVEDTLSCAIKFANGAMGVIEAATSVFKGFPKRIEILGTDGAIVLEEENIVRWDFADEKPQDKEIREKFANISNASGGSDPKAISIEGHILQYRDFVSAIENKTKLSIDGVEAKKAVSLIEAIYKSVETGKPVVL